MNSQICSKCNASFVPENQDQKERGVCSGCNSLQGQERGVENRAYGIKGGFQEQSIAIIYKLIEKGFSYGQIGAKIMLHRASVYRIKKRTWWPKNTARQQEIFEKLKSVEIGEANKIEGGVKL